MTKMQSLRDLMVRNGLILARSDAAASLAIIPFGNLLFGNDLPQDKQQKPGDPPGQAEGGGCVACSSGCQTGCVSSCTQGCQTECSNGCAGQMQM